MFALYSSLLLPILKEKNLCQSIITLTLQEFLIEVFGVVFFSKISFTVEFEFILEIL